MNRNETWAQGAKPGDPPIRSESVPIPREELDREAALTRIRAARRRAIVTGEIPGLIADILEILDV